MRNFRNMVSLLLAALLAAPIGAERPSELIPGKALFGNPVRTQARIAPDGSHLSGLAPSPEGVLDVWVQPTGRSQPPRQVTEDRGRGIRFHTWFQDGKYIPTCRTVAATRTGISMRSTCVAGKPATCRLSRGFAPRT